MDITEIWKPLKIPAKNKYEISNLGNLRRPLVKRSPYKYYKHDISPKMYHRVRIYISTGKSKRFLVHRLVAMHFIDNPDNKPFVLHNDNNPHNNCANNLRWGDQSENMIQAYADKQISAIGENNGYSVFTNDDILKIRELKQNGFSQRHLGRLYNVSQSHISLIVNRKIWAHI